MYLVLPVVLLVLGVHTAYKYSSTYKNVKMDTVTQIDRNGNYEH
jgi:hypothetical protein